MGGIRGETADLLERPLQPRDHAVERPCEPAQLVVGLGDVDPPIQSRRSDLVGRLDHAVDRCKGLARKHVAAAEGTDKGQGTGE